MAEFSVHQWIEGEQSGLDEDWEEESYREGCAYAREKAIIKLRALDDELLRGASRTAGRCWDLEIGRW